MKKILLSLATLIVIGGAIAGATIAFYNDTETSSGNIFTAGSIDLKVDHLKQTYNGMNCETCSLELFSSDGQNYVTDSSDNASYQGPFPKQAVLVSNPHPNWVNHNALSYKWVWVESSTSANDAGNIDVEYTFERDFYWNGVVGDIDFELALASDNGYAIYLNNVELANELDSEFNYNAIIQPLDGLEAAFINAVQLGNNTLKIVVRNHAQQGGTPSSNPAGLLYRLSIQRENCLDDIGFQNACRLWTEKDLEAGDTFFNFGDVKPGDFGTNVISLHVATNDAYSCLIVNDKNDQENVIYDPETDLNDTDEPEGELSQYLNVFTWDDANNNGNYDNGEDSLGSGSLASLSSIMSLDTINGEFLTATTTKYIGLAWCAGTLTPNEGGSFSCNGSGMLNDAQSDSFSATLTAYAVQTRNNPTFQCSGVNLGGGQQDNEVNQSDLDTTSRESAKANGKWFFYNDTNDTVMTIDQFGPNGQNHMDLVSGSEGAKMVLHDATGRYNIATYKYNDIKLSDIGTLTYRIYDASASSQTPYLHFNVDFDNSDTWQRRLVQVPTGVSANTWTTVDALAGSWTLSGGNWPAGGSEDGSKAGSVAKTWASIVADYPNAETRSTDSFFGIRVGHPGPAGEESYVDWVNFDGEVSDFAI